MDGWSAARLAPISRRANSCSASKADLDWASIKGDVTNGYCALTECGALIGTTCETKTNYIGTVAWSHRLCRGSRAAVRHRWLGLRQCPGWVDWHRRSRLPRTTPTTSWDGPPAAASKSHWATTGRPKIEYLYASLQSGSCTSSANCGFTNPPTNTVIANDTVKFTTSLVRVGVNFKFGGGLVDAIAHRVNRSTMHNAPGHDPGLCFVRHANIHSAAARNRSRRGAIVAP